MNETVSAETGLTAIGDYDNDGGPDLMVKFDRGQVEQFILNSGAVAEKFTRITLMIPGRFNDGTESQGCDTIKVIMPTP